MLARKRAVDLVEPIEDLFELIFWDTRACVLHLKRDVTIDSGSPDRDPTAFGCELQRVRDEICSDHFNLVVVERKLGNFLETLSLD